MTGQNLRHPSDLGKHGPRIRMTPAPHEFINKRPLKAAAMEMGTGAVDMETANPNTWFWYTPPETRAIPADFPHKDPTGSIFGRFTVVGLLPPKGRGNSALWLCRCSCGLYEGRSYKTISKGYCLDGMCHRCAKTIRDRKTLYRQSFFDRNGYWPSDESLIRMCEAWA